MDSSIFTRKVFLAGVGMEGDIVLALIERVALLEGCRFAERLLPARSTDPAGACWPAGTYLTG